MHAQATDEITHPDRGEIELAEVLHALSDPIRLRIVAELARSEGSPTCGSFDVPVSKSTCTHHFRVLREAGITLTRPEGTHRYVSLRREELDERFPGLLDAVLAAAEREAAYSTPAS